MILTGEHKTTPASHVGVVRLSEDSRSEQALDGLRKQFGKIGDDQFEDLKERIGNGAVKGADNIGRFKMVVALVGAVL